MCDNSREHFEKKHIGSPNINWDIEYPRRRCASMNSRAKRLEPCSDRDRDKLAQSMRGCSGGVHFSLLRFLRDASSAPLSTRTF
jgi:hypothetical protein